MTSGLTTNIERDEVFLRRSDFWQQKWLALEREAEEIRLGGGKAAQEKQRARGKMTARERVAALTDPGSDFLELGLWSAWGQYEEWGGAPAGGVIVGLGLVSGRDVVIVANDSTVKAGAWFPATCKKVLRAQEIALENRVPIIYLVDSAGAFLPLQDEVFPDKEQFGRAFFNNARLSAEGIFQMAAVMGPCVAGGAYLPVMSDESHIVEGTGSIFLAGSFLVKAAIGEQIENEELGGALVQADVSGVIDHRHKNDKDCLAKIRSQFAQLGLPERGPYQRREPKPPARPSSELTGVFPVERSRPYEMREMLLRILDGGEFDEFKENYGQSLLCGTGWIDGWAVGIVANQRKVVQAKTGSKESDREVQIGGVIYSDSADKGARFVELCNQKKIPLIFLQDVTGFMVGSRAEQGGIIKDGAKMVNAVSNSVVPKITIVMGNSYGAGNYAMCGKAYGARFLFAWPSSAIAVMGAEQASQTLLSIQLRNSDPTEAEKEELLNSVRSRYEAAMDPRYAASRLWTDGIIHPADTRSVISHCLAVASLSGEPEPFRTGVLQT